MALLRNPRFAALFAGQALSAIGSWATLIALWGYASFEFDVGAGELSLLGLAYAGPAVLVGPVAGVPIDRFGPKRMLIVADIVGGAAVLSVFLVDTYGQLLLIAAAVSFVEALEWPAFSALAPRLVGDERLLAANSVLSAAKSSALVFGPLLGASAIGFVGFEAAFVADAMTYLVGILVVLPLRLSPLEREPERRPIRALADGFRLVRARPGLRYVLVLSFPVFLTWGAATVLEPLYVRDVLERSPLVFAVLQVVFGVALFTVELLLPRLGGWTATRRTFALCVLISGFTMLAYLGTPFLGVACAGVFLWGVDVAFFAAPSTTLLQRGSPASMHGRVLAFQATLYGFGRVCALVLAGPLVGMLGVRGAAAVTALVPIGVGIRGVLRWRSLPSGEDADEAGFEPAVSVP